MEGNRNRTKVLGVRMSPDEIEMLTGEAKQRGFTELGPFVREVLLAAPALPSTTTLVLEAVLQTQYGMYEILKDLTENAGLPVTRIQKVRDYLEGRGPALVNKFVLRRSQKAKE